MDVAPDFRPFVARDDGQRLWLQRRRGAAAWLLRGCMYLLLLLALGLLALIPFAAYTRWRDWGEVASPILGSLVLLPITWLVLRAVLWAFRVEGHLRLDVGPEGVEVFGRGALLTWRERVRGALALEARTIRVSTEYRDVRYLALAARTSEGKRDLGHLELHPEGDATREAAVRAAAARIAERMRVPLELYDEGGARVEAA